MIVKNDSDRANLREAGRILSDVLLATAKLVKPGVTAAALDLAAEEMIRARGGSPAFLNYQPRGAAYPFPAALCVSINDEVVHGIPSEKRILKEGDIISLDLGINRKGLITDAAITVAVGKVSKELETLMRVTENALAAGIEAAQVGNHIGDISFAIQECARPHKYGVIQELGGHGVGHKVHEDPYVPNFGKKGAGHALEPGMVLALEPMFTLGSRYIRLGGDGYTITSQDHSPSAHFEHTIAITEKGPIILTEL